MSDGQTALPEVLASAARQHGPIGDGACRVLVIEAGGRISQKDFDDLQSAVTYADDAASEESRPIAYVCDSALAVLAQGRHYAAGPRDQLVPHRQKDPPND